MCFFRKKIGDIVDMGDIVGIVIVLVLFIIKYI